MFHRRVLLSVILAAMAAASMPVDARVMVTFVDPASFTDIGAYDQDPRRTLAEFEQYLGRLGERYLTPHETLRIEVLDISLAGRSGWPRQANAPTRIMTGEADWPRFELRYTLERDGKASHTVEETVVDTVYLRRLEWRYLLVPLPYEIRTLDQWFKARFSDTPQEMAPVGTLGPGFADLPDDRRK
jgi:hypothetical protein